MTLRPSINANIMVLRKSKLNHMACLNYSLKRRRVKLERRKAGKLRRPRFEGYDLDIRETGKP